MEKNIRLENLKKCVDESSEQNADVIVEVANLSGQVSCKKKRQSSVWGHIFITKNVTTRDARRRVRGGGS